VTASQPRLVPFQRLGMLERGLLAAIALAFLLLPNPAKAWWNDDWSFRKKISIDASPKGAPLAGDPGRMPLLIRLSDGNFKFDEAKEDGSDLRFIAGDDKTPLKYHIEKFDSLFGMALIWVDVPSVKAGATTDLYMYYGNAKAPAAVDTPGTYDGDQTLVYHFAEKAEPPRDSTLRKNDAQTPGKTVDGSLIGSGLKLDGTGLVTLPASPSLAIGEGGTMTVSAWIKPEKDKASGIIYAKRDGEKALLIGLDQGLPYVAVVNGTATTLRSQPAEALAAGKWHHLAVTSGEQLALYVDGQSRGSLAFRLPALSGAAILGNDSKQGAAAFIGELDELEISKIARPAGFISALAASQSPEPHLVVYGEDEQTASWTGGYFGIILKSVTLDGWVVIGLLMIMSVISWIVMINKAIYVGSVARADQIFLRLFRKMGTNLTALEDDSAFETVFAGDLTRRERQRIEDSSLYRIYSMGLDELHARIGNGRGGRGMSTHSIEAIRATLDAGVVRETQRLNRMMVLLTIAISGGPFLGLLGTVVGVMITFAAIAAAGDVNVNAIAPGIAAALVATVAGLGVAIPALFGYNYLLTRIKDVTADMRVFVDEFVTKLAEYYSTSSVQDLAAE
jgi:biopolymer transport protein ExbB